MAIADQLAELNTLRENLATAINGNGVDASTAEGLSSLVQKAGQVAEMYKGMIDASITEVYSTAKTVRNSAFYSCDALTSVDLPVATSIGVGAFRFCAALDTLILRKSDKICTLKYKNALESTPIESGTGYIYVPAALVGSYKASNNWSTYANQIRAIEDYPEICGGAV